MNPWEKVVYLQKRNLKAVYLQKRNLTSINLPDRFIEVYLHQNNLTSVNLPDGVELVTLDLKTSQEGTLAKHQHEFL